MTKHDPLRSVENTVKLVRLQNRLLDTEAQPHEQMYDNLVEAHELLGEVIDDFEDDLERLDD